MAELRWPPAADDDLRARAYALICAVVELGGAVGWLTRPARSETDAWLDGVLGGGDLLCTAWDDEGLAALGVLARRPAHIHRFGREIQKVMTHPRARGAGLARMVCTALVERARADGAEHVLLSVRHNNASALALYGSLGFREVGRFPGTIAVRDLRFDAVWLQRDLDRADGVELWGDRVGGPGS